ncbi:uncharacterized protein [Lolium perenne]|uniref:uncharacterized protein n=1 Tax=Lolium perenne TaxID=4522 RepID=UPI003A98D582
MGTAGNACSGSRAHDDSISGEALLDLNRSPPVDGGGGGEKEATIVAGSPVAVDCLDRSRFEAGGSSHNEALTPIDAGKRASPIVVDLDRSPLAGEGCSRNEAPTPIAAGTRASPVVVDLDGSPVSGGGGSQHEALSSIAAGTRASPVVVDLDGSPVAGGGGSQHEPPIAAGTQALPIDVESLVDEGRRNRTVTMRRRRVIVFDVEAGTDQQGGSDARTLHLLPGGSKRRRVGPVICLSPVRLERSSNQGLHIFPCTGGTEMQRSAFVPVSRPRAKAAPKEPVFTCPVCLNKIEQPSTTSCGHVFCEKCIQESIKAQKKCPTCRKKLGPKSFHRVYLPATADQC